MIYTEQQTPLSAIVKGEGARSHPRTGQFRPRALGEGPYGAAEKSPGPVHANGSEARCHGWHSPDICLDYNSRTIIHGKRETSWPF